jgi:hypothetical protein
MPRGIPWDDLTLFREKKADVAPIVPCECTEIEPRDFNKDAYAIGKRALFGLVVRFIYIYTYIYVHIYVCICIYLYIYMCIHIYIYTNLYTYTYIFIHIYIYIYMYTVRFFNRHLLWFGRYPTWCKVHGS